MDIIIYVLKKWNFFNLQFCWQIYLFLANITAKYLSFSETEIFSQVDIIHFSSCHIL